MVYIVIVYIYINIHRYRYISISPFCFHHKQHKQDDVCDTFSIFLRISDSGIQDQIFSKKECKQKLPYWGGDEETPKDDVSSY